MPLCAMHFFHYIWHGNLHCFLIIYFEDEEEPLVVQTHNFHIQYDRDRDDQCQNDLVWQFRYQWFFTLLILFNIIENQYYRHMYRGLKLSYLLCFNNYLVLLKSLHPNDSVSLFKLECCKKSILPSYFIWVLKYHFLIFDLDGYEISYSNFHV